MNYTYIACIIAFVVVVVVIIRFSKKEKVVKKIDRDCMVNEWSEWSPCEKCGGMKRRTRTIYQPSLGKGKGCPPLEEEEPCAPCTTPPVRTGPAGTPPVDDRDCTVSEWSEWSPCEKCGGVKRRTRTIYQPSLGKGKGCPPLEEEEPCAPCTTPSVPTGWTGMIGTTGPIGPAGTTPPRTGWTGMTGATGPAGTIDDRDCTVNEWSEWSPCEKCGGVKRRTRTIYQKGKGCPLLEEEEPCTPCVKPVIVSPQLVRGVFDQGRGRAPEIKFWIGGRWSIPNTFQLKQDAKMEIDVRNNTGATGYTGPKGIDGSAINESIPNYPKTFNVSPYGTLKNKDSTEYNLRSLLDNGNNSSQQSISVNGDGKYDIRIRAESTDGYTEWSSWTPVNPYDTPEIENVSVSPKCVNGILQYTGTSLLRLNKSLSDIEIEVDIQEIDKDTSLPGFPRSLNRPTRDHYTISVDNIDPLKSYNFRISTKTSKWSDWYFKRGEPKNKKC